MNSNTKILIGSLIGAGFGYFVGAVIVEIIAIKTNPNTMFNKDMMEPWEELEKDGYKNYQPGLKMGKNKPTRNYNELLQKNPDIAKLVEKYNGGQSIDDPEPIEDDMMSEGEFDDQGIEDNQPISVISLAEYANAEGFEMITLNYYDDDVVTDERDEPINHPEQIIGDEALVSFGELSNDPDVVYVRNSTNKAMYEVVRTNKNYGAQLQKNRRLQAKAAMHKKIDRIDTMGDQND